MLRGSERDVAALTRELMAAGFDDTPELEKFSESSGGGPELLAFPATEAGAAERFVAIYGAEVRYVHERRAWITWTGRAGVWRFDRSGQAERWVLASLRAARAACREHPAAAIASGSDPAKLEGALLRMETARAIAAILELARILPGVTISAGDLDAHRYLLGVQNGTLNLMRGELLEPRREDYITKQCNVAYDPAALCPSWVSFISRAMGYQGDATPEEKRAAAARVDFLRRAFGLSLSGDVRDKVVFCLFGPKDSGKTTALETIKWVLGDYATQIRVDSLLSNSNQSDGNTQSDLAGLQGRRFVTTSEAESSQRISEATLKYLTQGGETKIKAARKYENMAEFHAVHKLWLDSNHRPNIKGSDDSIWKRLKPIGFEHPVGPDEVDLDLPNKLKAEGPGILRWALAGFQRWLSDGLGDPPDVQAARAEWQAECDPLRPFIDERCIVAIDDPDCWCASGELFAAYEAWARDSGERFPLGRRHFGERLKALGCIENRRRDEQGGRFRTWEGIEIARV